MQAFIPYFSTIGRILISAIFLLSGISKTSAFEATEGYMAAMGVPAEMLPIVIVFEMGAAIAVIIGFKTRVVAFMLAGFTL